MGPHDYLTSIGTGFKSIVDEMGEDVTILRLLSSNFRPMDDYPAKSNDKMTNHSGFLNILGYHDRWRFEIPGFMEG